MFWGKGKCYFHANESGLMAKSPYYLSPGSCISTKIPLGSTPNSQATWILPFVRTNLHLRRSAFWFVKIQIGVIAQSVLVWYQPSLKVLWKKMTTLPHFNKNVGGAIEMRPCLARAESGIPLSRKNLHWSWDARGFLFTEWGPIS